MQISNMLILALGFGSQLLFFARTMVQWFLSEKEGKVLSPLLFWKISLFASVLMLLYGLCRNDFAIVFGQLLVYYIYIRNLQLQGAWIRFSFGFRVFAWIIPVLCFSFFIGIGKISLIGLLQADHIKQWLLFWGIAAQLLFAFRFVYQWVYSERRKESHLPLGFWYISIAGSAMILVYAIYRHDLVLFLGHLGSMVLYLRNILLHFTGKGVFELIRIKQKV